MNLVNGFDQETNQAIVEVSMELADIFEDNIIYESITDVMMMAKDQGTGVVLISEEGMEMLGDKFSEIEESLREAVFGALLDELTERNVPFDIEQFKSDA